ncbi:MULTISPECIES: hypothetical protein [unclassified Chelatococcus]|uniref:hypothetical protein n=1 Tax=unclassified Chelatococcus TaxID=2638111 RepID=UPI001BCF0D36|nr:MULTISPECIES: hypothetical protein [unclassified Chelatococcus]MBS7700765.1 hypothetical protein [Chelatococcus sp. YT9]MBX3559349.1 hypothetical protein [Chelatococcus sp.]
MSPTATRANLLSFLKTVHGSKKAVNYILNDRETKAYGTITELASDYIVVGDPAKKFRTLIPIAAISAITYEED